jgi:hypothetical protein
VNKTLFSLGRTVFFAQNCNPSFEQELEILLPRYSQSTAVKITPLAIETQGTNNLRALINVVLKNHSGCVWIDAGCLIAPSGAKILLSGFSGAGKSTTTMALAIGYGWKVVAEDLLLIDVEEKKLLTFASPFSLKQGTLELLRDSIGRLPEPILHGEWSPLKDMAASGEYDAKFDFTILLEQIKPNAGKGLELVSMHPTTYLRKLIRISNILRIDGAAEVISEAIDKSECFTFIGGTLRERVDAIRKLSGESGDGQTGPL